jgi:hypothetical protein
VSSNTSQHPRPGQAIRGSAAPPPGGRRPGEENNEKTAAISRDGLSLPLKESKSLFRGPFVEVFGGRGRLLQDTVSQKARILADETFDLVRDLGVVA